MMKFQTKKGQQFSFRKHVYLSSLHKAAEKLKNYRPVGKLYG